MSLLLQPSKTCLGYFSFCCVFLVRVGAHMGPYVFFFKSVTFRVQTAPFDKITIDFCRSRRRLHDSDLPGAKKHKIGLKFKNHIFYGVFLPTPSVSTPLVDPSITEPEITVRLTLEARRAWPKVSSEPSASLISHCSAISEISESFPTLRKM